MHVRRSADSVVHDLHRFDLHRFIYTALKTCTSRRSSRVPHPVPAPPGFLIVEQSLGTYAPPLRGRPASVHPGYFSVQPP